MLPLHTGEMASFESQLSILIYKNEEVSLMICKYNFRIQGNLFTVKNMQEQFSTFNSYRLNATINHDSFDQYNITLPCMSPKHCEPSLERS